MKALHLHSVEIFFIIIFLLIIMLALYNLNQYVPKLHLHQHTKKIENIKKHNILYLLQFCF